MKRTLVVSFLLSCALAASAATPPPANNLSSSAPVQVSTGVTAPQLVRSAVVHIAGDNYLFSIPTPTTMLVHVYLTATGAPTRIQILRSISPFVDAEVVRAIQQFHWKPAMLDNRAVPYDMDLNVVVQH